MRKKLEKIFSWVDKLSEGVGKISSWFSLLCVAVIVYDVCMRYFFNRPTLWGYDYTYLLSSVALTLAIPWTQKEKGHVRVDAIYNLIPRRGQALINVILTPFLTFFMLYSGLLVMYGEVIRSWAIKERAFVSAAQPYLFPFKTWAFVAFFLFGLQFFVDWCREIFILIGGENA